MITKSPVSTCGVYCGLCLPLRICAAFAWPARPSTWSVASIKTHPRARLRRASLGYGFTSVLHRCCPCANALRHAALQGLCKPPSGRVSFFESCRSFRCRVSYADAPPWAWTPASALPRAPAGTRLSKANFRSIPGHVHESQRKTPTIRGDLQKVFALQMRKETAEAPRSGYSAFSYRATAVGPRSSRSGGRCVPRQSKPQDS